MSLGLVVIAHNALADPRRTGPAAEPHLIHEEIPIIEEVLCTAGWEPLAIPVGADVLGALGALEASGGDEELAFGEAGVFCGHGAVLWCMEIQNTADAA
mgnify:CR=1 FL=1